MQQTIGMMDALSVARDLRADDARGVEIVLGAAHPADRAAVEHLHLECAGGRTVVRTGGSADLGVERLVHRNRPTSTPAIIYQPSAVRRDLPSRYPAATTKIAPAAAAQRCNCSTVGADST